MRTTGVVTADFDERSQRGFYLQAAQCDSDPATSDGIFVFLGEQIETVRVGDGVDVSGVVQEYYGFTELEAKPVDVHILAHGNPLPEAESLNPPFDNAAARSYFEAREGMLVGLGDGRVVGPAGSSGGVGLNNAGDTLTLADASGRVITVYAYNSTASNDQSLTRDPDIFGE